jgi:hypothetical protein
VVVAHCTQPVELEGDRLDLGGDEVDVEDVEGAVPGIPQVTVDTVPGGASVYMDRRFYGVAPTTVPIPTEKDVVELCVEHRGKQTCRMLGVRVLVLENPYIFDTRRGPGE